MPLQNRVTPFSELVSDPARGLLYGNRGCLHDDSGRIRRTYATRRWIACQLEFRGWQRGPKLQPGRFTELFFLDEATAFAAGHRPCALCRREDYEAYRTAWGKGLGGERPSAKELNRRLHAERNVRGTSRRRWHAARWEDLPAGAYVLLYGVPALVLERTVVPWTTAGYGTPRPRPRTGGVELVTPPASVAALRAGYQPQVDPAAAG
jgi:hypothetical protein